jgi:hypothetical protein
MWRAFVWGYGWTFGRFAAELSILLVIAFFSLFFSKEGRQTLLGILIFIGMGVFFLFVGLPVMQAEWDRQDRAYAICMQGPPEPADWVNYDGSTLGKSSWYSYQKKLVDYQRRVGVKQLGEW